MCDEAGRFELHVSPGPEVRLLAVLDDIDPFYNIDRMCLLFNTRDYKLFKSSIRVLINDAIFLGSKGIHDIYDGL